MRHKVTLYTLLNFKQNLTGLPRAQYQFNNTINLLYGNGGWKDVHVVWQEWTIVSSL
jgi:hypothetical protein